MIQNYILRTAIKNLKDKRNSLTLRKNELSAAISELRISKQAAWKHNTGLSDKINPELMDKRNAISKQTLAVDKELMEVNNQLRDLYRKEEAERNSALLSVFKDLFTQEQMIEIKQEAERRAAGEDPKLLNLNFKRLKEYEAKYYGYRELAKEQVMKMIEFRVMLTGIVEKGCEQFGNADFLKFISPLNRLILPLSELEKIKKNHLL